ncbi:MAG: VOC family protein [Oscillospiraceae bacterium]|nr:VOC family protein [Oscillospiraceae bacterium]
MRRSMMQAYVKDSADAVPFYVNAFNAKLLCDHRHENGMVAHAELDVFGQVFAICETLESETVTGNSMQFCLHFGEGKEETVRKIIESLSAGGKINYSGAVEWSPLMGDLTDRFGIRWCVFV